LIDSFAPINPNLIDVVLPEHDGYPDSLAAEDTRDVMFDRCGDASRDFPRALWIEQKDWADKARDNDKYGTWPVNHCDRFTNQDPTHECTCHSLRANFEIARNRARGVIYDSGPKKDFRYDQSAKFGSVWVSPLSVYSEANPRKTGGASCGHVLEIATRRGFLPEKIQPRDYGFRHDLQGTTGRGGKNQSSGAWVSVANFPAGWKETARHFRIQEVIFPESADEIMCLVLHGYSVCVGRNGHAIPYSLANVSTRAVGYVDSYDVIRWDSWGTVRSAVGGAYAIASVTTPDDWNKPAGAGAV